MTLESTIAENLFDGNGVQTVFAFTFKVWTTSEVIAMVDDVIKVHGATVTIAITDTDAGTGTATFTTPPPTGTDNVVLKRAVTQVQPTEYPHRAKLDTEELEETLDRLTAMVQDNSRDLENHTFNWRGTWSATKNYAVGDAVYWNGTSYRCITASLNNEPPNTTYWIVVASKGDSGGLVWRGDWDSGTTYAIGDGVLNDGSSYIATAANTNQEPPNATYWDVLAEGGVDGEMTGPGSSTADAVVLFSGTSGQIVKDSGLAPSGNADKLLGVNSAGDAWEMKDAGGSGMLAVSPNVRLTLESGVPVSTSAQTAKTTLYCTAGSSKLWNGSTWQVYDRAELSITLASLTSNLPYAVYEYLNGSTPTLELQAWTNSTTRASAIDTDTSTGLKHKTGDKTRAWRGDILIKATGQCEDSTSYRGVFNAYNRVPRSFLATDSTNSWAYSTAAYRSFRNNTTLGTGKVQAMIGEKTWCNFMTTMFSDASNMVGVGINSTSTNSAMVRGAFYVSYAYGPCYAHAKGDSLLRVGENSVYPLEHGGTSGNFFGDDGGISALFQTGLIGEVLM